MTDPSGLLLQARGVSKRFGGIQALDAVDFYLAPGEIVGLVGENGAGKSTLIKILAGVQQPDGGRVTLGGAPYAPPDPAAARAAGVAVIHQHFELVSDLSVAVNLFLGDLPVRRRLGFPTVDRQALRRRAEELLQNLGLSLDPERPVADLSLAERQLLEIARALARQARLLIMDEPTASLERREVERLFALVRQARDQGTGVIFTSHRLEEVLALSDRVTVLRNGRVVGDRPTAELNLDELIELIVGRAVPRGERAACRPGGPTVLRADGLRGGELTSPLSLEVHGGEVVALTGLLGSGSHQVPRLLGGQETPAAGEVRVAGVALPPVGPAAAVAAGVGFVPEDRRRHGLVMGLTVEQNMLLPNLRRVTGPLGFFSRRKIRALLAPLMSALQIKGELHTRVEDLSGGNQQKVVIARWLAAGCKVLAMVEPTHGVDVGAKAEVHRLVRAFTEGGGAAVFASVEVPEALANADRTLAFRHGRVVADAPTAATDEARIMRCIAG